MRHCEVIHRLLGPYLSQHPWTRWQLSTHPLHIRLYSSVSHPQPGETALNCWCISSIKFLKNIQTLPTVQPFCCWIHTFDQPDRGGIRHNLSSDIKKRIAGFFFTNDLTNTSERPWRTYLTQEQRHMRVELLAASVSAKVEDDNIGAAVTNICSEGKPAENSSETCPPPVKLFAKQPTAAIDCKPSTDQDLQLLPEFI